VGAVKAAFAARAAKCVARIRDRLFQLGFAARIAAAMADWIWIKHGDRLLSRATAGHLRPAVPSLFLVTG
jgi:hypothetical protein